MIIVALKPGMVTHPDSIPDAEVRENFMTSKPAFGTFNIKFSSRLDYVDKLSYCCYYFKDQGRNWNNPNNSILK